jgi:hypothetical protein
MWQFFQNYTTSCRITGVLGKEDAQKSLHPFPNPTSNFITINLTNEYFTLLVFDHTGKKVKEQLSVTGNYQLNCTELSKGLYYIQAIGEKKTLTSKFIKL